jgi:lipopolysaccharide biosynthesis glycosyltransferase
VASRGLAYARDHQQRIAHWDQDILNVLFRDNWVCLHERWNVCPHLYGLNPSVNAAAEALSDSEQEALRRPAIVHYAGGGRVKPWSYHCSHPLRQLYRDHAARTPWADVPLINRPAPPLVRLWNRSLFRLKCEARKLLPSR